MQLLPPDRWVAQPSGRRPRRPKTWGRCAGSWPQLHRLRHASRSGDVGSHGSSWEEALPLFQELIANIGAAHIEVDTYKQEEVLRGQLSEFYQRRISIALHGRPVQPAVLAH